MIRIVSLTDKGAQLAKLIADKLSVMNTEYRLQHKPSPFTSQVQTWFSQGDRLILITATGIAVRTLAPVLQDKYSDPAVLVMDELGQFVIPLLSGHEGGANDWGQQIANLMGAQLAMTTANTYTQPIYSMGLGCERNCPISEIEALVKEALSLSHLQLAQIACFASIDIKADESALIALIEKYNKPFNTYSAAALSTVENLLQTPSKYVYQTVGVYGVAESAALYAVKQQTNSAPELHLPKIKNSKATCAIAKAYRGDKEASK